MLIDSELLRGLKRVCGGAVVVHVRLNQEHACERALSSYFLAPHHQLLDRFKELKVGWLVGWMMDGWLAGWLVGWLTGWQVGWLAVGRLAGWLDGRLAGWLLAGWLMGIWER